MALPPSPNCPHCGLLLPPTALICPNCGMFVHAQQLTHLSNEALQLESTNPIAAAARWREILDLIPPNSPQYQNISYRMAKLAAGIHPADPPPTSSPQTRPVQDDSLSLALLKTIGSMIISIIVYTAYFQSASGGTLRDNAIFSTTFVGLILIHEMGHVLANRYYGLSAGPPIFLPFVGAIINLRQPPQNAKVEAIVGIGGPIAGTLGALATYILYLHTGKDLFLVAAHLGFLINLFNLLPVPPLDGGRVTAAVSPWIWMLGIAGLLLFLVQALIHHDWWTVFILALIARFAYPRIVSTLRSKGRSGEYYNISRLASWTIGFLYLTLGLSLIYLVIATAV